MRVLKHCGMWHFWCDHCYGGDWETTWRAAMDRALNHIAARHGG